MKELRDSFLLLTRNSSPQKNGKEKPAIQLPYDNAKKLVRLPDPRAIKFDVQLRTAIEKRQSVREYSGGKLTMEEFSYLLWCTQGVKEVKAQKVTFRTVPSAGARHAFETYLLVNNVEGLNQGLYRFLAIEHQLVLINDAPDLPEKITEACLNQSMVKQGAVTFIWTAVTSRMTYRYGARGLRYLFLDAGHVCQNLYLAAAAIDCGVCAIAAFSDEMINPLLNIDGLEHFVIYLGALGKK